MDTEHHTVKIVGGGRRVCPWPWSWGDGTPFDEDIPENVVRINNDEDAPVICRAKGKRGKIVVGLLNENSGSCGRVTGGVQL